MSTRHFGFNLTEHKIRVPWDPFNDPAGESFELFAREIAAPGKEDAPALVYFQGGPGFPAPRPTSAGGSSARR